MQPPRRPLRLAVLLGLMLAPSALRAGAADEALEAQIGVLQDQARPDSQRATARRLIASSVARGDNPAVLDRVIKLGNEATANRVRFDVAFILAQTSAGKSVVPPNRVAEVTALLQKWYEAADSDASVRLWSAVGLANTQDPKVLDYLKEKALKPDGDAVLRVAVARALAGWRGEVLEKQIAPLLLEWLSAKDPEIVIAGCDALRLTELDTEGVIEPLLALARDSADERIWRAAATTLGRLGGSAIFIKGGADDAERKAKLQAWENAWRVRKKRAVRTEKEG